MRSRCLAVLAGCVFAYSVHPAIAAIVRYEYDGNPFVVTSGSPPPSVTHLSGSFTVNEFLLPLAPFSSSNITSAVTSFSFTDGNQTLTNSNVSAFSFTISLDSSLALIAPWSINLSDALGRSLSTSSFTPSQCNDTTRGPTGYFATIQCFSGVDNAGTWSGPSAVVGSPTPVPEPTSLALLTGALGVLGFGGVAVRRRARTIRQSPAIAP